MTTEVLEIVVYREGSPRRSLLDLEDALEGKQVLPGFKLEVGKLFA